jgi:hypothetical protein
VRDRERPRIGAAARGIREGDVPHLAEGWQLVAVGDRAGFQDLAADKRLDVSPPLGEVLGPRGGFVRLEDFRDERFGQRGVHLAGRCPPHEDVATLDAPVALEPLVQEPPLPVGTGYPDVHRRRLRRHRRDKGPVELDVRERARLVAEKRDLIEDAADERHASHPPPVAGTDLDPYAV